MNHGGHQVGHEGVVGGDAQDEQQRGGHGGQQQEEADHGQPGRPLHRLRLDAAAGDQAVQRHRADQGAGRTGAEDHGDDVDDLVHVLQAGVARGEHDGQQEAEEDLHTGLGDADLLDELAPHPVGALLLGLVAPSSSFGVVAYDRHGPSSPGSEPVRLPYRLPRGRRSSRRWADRPAEGLLCGPAVVLGGLSGAATSGPRPGP
jgi:hypothetical protein